VIRRDKLYAEGGKLASAFVPRDTFIGQVAGLLEEIQTALHTDARARLDSNIERDVADFSGLETFFTKNGKFPGWVEVQWSRPTGAALDAVVERLKGLKLTIRNTPLDAAAADGACIFTGEPAVERILIGRSY
jgi:prolyl-tRNA synthetase